MRMHAALHPYSLYSVVSLTDISGYHCWDWSVFVKVTDASMLQLGTQEKKDKPMGIDAVQMCSSPVQFEVKALTSSWLDQAMQLLSYSHLSTSIFFLFEEQLSKCETVQISF